VPDFDDALLLLYSMGLVLGDSIALLLPYSMDLLGLLLDVLDESVDSESMEEGVKGVAFQEVAM